MEKKKEDIISRRAALEIEIFFQQRVIDQLAADKGILSKIDHHLAKKDLKELKKLLQVLNSLYPPQ